MKRNKQQRRQQDTSKQRSPKSSPTQFAPQIYLPAPILERPIIGNVHLYVTYQDVFGKFATINQLTTLLSQLNINDAVRAISVINNLAVGDPSKPFNRSLQLLLAELMFSEEKLEKLSASPLGHDPRTVLFHHHQQLFLLRHALTSCTHEGGLPWETKAHHIFGEACLVTNDLIGSQGAGTNTEDADITAAHKLISLIELGSNHEPVSLIGRAVYLWHRVPNEDSLKKEADYINFAKEFREAYEIDLETFMDIVLLVYTYVCGSNIEPNEIWKQYVIDINKTFINIRYDKEDICKAMKLISYPLMDMGNYLYQQPSQSPKHDFTVLRRFPSIEVIEGVYVVYAKELLLRFLTEGIWWRIHDALPEEKQGSFRSFFGKVYARYIEHILSHCCDEPKNRKRHKLILRPHFDRNTEVCDAIVVADDTWVMIEVKASLFTTRARYSEDVSVLKRELDDRFFGKPREKNIKGVSQLANSIIKLANGERILNSDLDFATAKSVEMVIVSYDLAAVGKFTEAYLDRKMRETFVDLPMAPRIRRLTILGSNDLEAFTAISGRQLLPHLLASYRHHTHSLEHFKDHIFERYSIDKRKDEFFLRESYEAIYGAIVTKFKSSP